MGDPFLDYLLHPDEERFRRFVVAYLQPITSTSRPFRATRVAVITASGRTFIFDVIISCKALQEGSFREEIVVLSSFRRTTVGVHAPFQGSAVHLNWDMIYRRNSDTNCRLLFLGSCHDNSVKE